MHNIANRKERIDMTNRGKVILNIFVVGALILTILVTGGFVKETCRYALIGEQIREIESNGNEVIYNRGGKTCGWDVHPELKVKYENKINERKALVESSDVAAWVSASADTVTGKIIRVCALIISIMICISSVYFLYRLLLQDMGYLLEVLRMK